MIIKNATMAQINPFEVNSISSDGNPGKKALSWLKGATVKHLVVQDSTVKKGFTHSEARGWEDIHVQKLSVFAETLETCAFYKFKANNVYCNATLISSKGFGMVKVQNLEFGPDVERLERESFYHCKGLRSVVLSNHIKYLGRAAFRWTEMEELIVRRATLKSGSLAECHAKIIQFEGNDDVNDTQGSTKLVSGAIVLNNYNNLLVFNDPDLVICANSIHIPKLFRQKYNLTIKFANAKKIAPKAILVQTKTMEGITILDHNGKSLNDSEIVFHQPE